MAHTDGSGVDVAVVGGGIVGLAVAWRACQRGLSVVVAEREEIGHGASHVAAGMLAPVAEVEFGEHGRRVLELGQRSAAMWPAFAAELERTSGIEVGLRHTGTLMVAHDDDEARELERQLALRRWLGVGAVRLRASQAREREPALAPVMRLALEIPDDHSVDPRLVVAALRISCERAGVELREHTAVSGILLDADGRCVEGVALSEGTDDAKAARSGERCPDGTGRDGGGRGSEALRARRIVVAAGAWSGGLAGLPVHAHLPVRPVKGQIMLLRDPAGPGLLTRPVRFTGGYLVPRPDGRYVLGGTVEERGFDPRPTAGATYELLRDAHRVVPGVSELELLELGVGYRPGTPDNGPAIGCGALEGLVWATGHYRNGILLAPLTAELVVALLAEGEHGGDGRLGELPQEDGRKRMLAICNPARFAAAVGAEAADAAAVS
jgi:glycine oxidase